MQADSMLSIVISRAIREHPEMAQADMLKLMGRQTKLEEESQELRRRVAQLLVAHMVQSGSQ